MNTRANIMYFIEHFLDLAKEGHADYIRMMQRDIIRVVDAVAPDDGSGAANVKVVRKVRRSNSIYLVFPLDLPGADPIVGSARPSGQGAPRISDRHADRGRSERERNQRRRPRPHVFSRRRRDGGQTAGATHPEEQQAAGAAQAGQAAD